MKNAHRFTVAVSILLVGVVLGAFAGFPAEALRWETFSAAYEDMVVVTRAEYRSDDNELRVRADSSSATSILSVYHLSGALIGVLTRDDETRHEGRFDLATNPLVITVRSSEGGEATVLVTGDNPPTVTPAASATATATASPTQTASASPRPTATATGGTGGGPTKTATAGTPTITPENTKSATATGGTDGPTSTPVTTIGPPIGRLHLPAVFDNAAMGG